MTLLFTNRLRSFMCLIGHLRRIETIEPQLMERVAVTDGHPAAFSGSALIHTEYSARATMPDGNELFQYVGSDIRLAYVSHPRLNLSPSIRG